MYLQGGRKNEGALQEMARNLTIAVAPDDFKPANQLEPQVKLLQSYDATVHALTSRWWHRLFLHRPQVHVDELCPHQILPVVWVHEYLSTFQLL